MTATLNPTDILNAQPRCDSHSTAGVEDTNFPDAHIPADSQHALGVGESNSLTPNQGSTASHVTESAPNFPDAHKMADSQETCGVGELNLPQPKSRAKTTVTLAAATNLPDAQIVSDSQFARGVGDQAGTKTAQNSCDSQAYRGGLGPILRDPTLALAADVVDDLEKVRDANNNRLRTLTNGEYGHGMTLEHPDVKRLATLVKALNDAEHQASLNLSRVMRNHPLGAFVKASKGVGEKQAARLLASIGDPYWNDLHNRPRKLRELYRFCGMDVVGTSAHNCCDSQSVTGAGVAPSKVRGERVHWSPNARMRLWLIASKCVMVGHGGPYRAIYEAGRIKYADAIHAEECKRCGPKGKPAQPGSPLSAGHQNARAIRLIAKAILRDLWTEAQRLHIEAQEAIA